MSRSYVAKALREQVAREARYRCGYCLTSARVTGTRMEIDHIIPESLGGLTVEENLWLACSMCNDHKGNRIAAPDPLTRALSKRGRKKLALAIQVFEGETQFLRRLSEDGLTRSQPSTPRRRSLLRIYLDSEKNRNGRAGLHLRGEHGDRNGPPTRAPGTPRRSPTPSRGHPLLSDPPPSGAPPSAR